MSTPYTVLEATTGLDKNLWSIILNQPTLGVPEFFALRAVNQELRKLQYPLARLGIVSWEELFLRLRHLQPSLRKQLFSSEISFAKALRLNQISIATFVKELWNQSGRKTDQHLWVPTDPQAVLGQPTPPSNLKALQTMSAEKGFNLSVEPHSDVDSQPACLSKTETELALNGYLPLCLTRPEKKSFGIGKDPEVLLLALFNSNQFRLNWVTPELPQYLKTILAFQIDDIWKVHAAFTKGWLTQECIAKLPPEHSEQMIRFLFSFSGLEALDTDRRMTSKNEALPDAENIPWITLEDINQAQNLDDLYRPYLKNKFKNSFLALKESGISLEPYFDRIPSELLEVFIGKRERAHFLGANFSVTFNLSDLRESFIQGLTAKLFTMEELLNCPSLLTITKGGPQYERNPYKLANIVKGYVIPTNTISSNGPGYDQKLFTAFQMGYFKPASVGALEDDYIHWFDLAMGQQTEILAAFNKAKITWQYLDTLTRKQKMYVFSEEGVEALQRGLVTLDAIQQSENSSELPRPLFEKEFEKELTEFKADGLLTKEVLYQLDPAIAKEVLTGPNTKVLLTKALKKNEITLSELSEEENTNRFLYFLLTPDASKLSDCKLSYSEVVQLTQFLGGPDWRWELFKTVPLTADMFSAIKDGSITVQKILALPNREAFEKLTHGYSEGKSELPKRNVETPPTAKETVKASEAVTAAKKELNQDQTLGNPDALISPLQRSLNSKLQEYLRHKTIFHRERANLLCTTLNNSVGLSTLEKHIDTQLDLFKKPGRRFNPNFFGKSVKEENRLTQPLFHKTFHGPKWGYHGTLLECKKLISDFEAQHPELQEPPTPPSYLPTKSQ